MAMGVSLVKGGHWSCCTHFIIRAIITNIPCNGHRSGQRQHLAKSFGFRRRSVTICESFKETKSINQTLYQSTSRERAHNEDSWGCKLILMKYRGPNEDVEIMAMLGLKETAV